MRIFDKPKDYEAFEDILAEAVRREKMRLLAYCVMPNIGIWFFGRVKTATSRRSSAG